MAGTIEKIKAKVENVLHKDKDTTHTGTHAHNTGSGLTGTHTTHGSDPTGPHNSHIANVADPRVDSDRIGGAGNTASAGGIGSTAHGTGLGSTTHGTGLGNTSHTHSHGNDPSGPHSSHAANVLDPRVDSDKYGAAGNTASAGGYGSTTHGTGLGNTTHGTGLGNTTHSTSSHSTSGLGSHTASGDPSGPHSSKLANKFDPTVDRSSYGTADPTTGHYANTHGTTSSGLTGSHNTHVSDPSGPHDSHLANRADPRVDSDHYGAAGNTATAGGVGAGQYGSTTGSGHTGHNTHTTVGSGHSTKTAGPHNSDLLNKLDPRVDSDVDGSKTVGPNRTYN